MKGSWFIEIDKGILNPINIKPIYHKIPQKITIPLGFGVFDEDDYDLFKTWLDIEIQIPVAGVIVSPELELQLLKIDLPNTIRQDFGRLDSPAKSQCALISYKTSFDPDILFQEIDIAPPCCKLKKITGIIKFQYL